MSNGTSYFHLNSVSEVDYLEALVAVHIGEDQVVGHHIQVHNAF